jgi:hypothetical protein
MSRRPLIDPANRALLLLVLLLYGGCVWVARNPERRVEEARKLFLDFDPAAVLAVELERGPELSERLGFEARARAVTPDNPRGDFWWLTSPVRERADGAVIQGLLDQLPLLDAEAELEASRASELGLEPPRLRLTITRREAAPLALELGAPLPGDRRALRVVGRDGPLALVRESFAERLTAPLSSFRERAAFSLRLDALTRIQLESRAVGPLAARRYDFRRVGLAWRAAGGTGEYVAPEALRQLGDALCNLEAKLVDDSELWGEQLLEPWGLAPAALTARLEGREGVSQSIEVGAPSGRSKRLRRARFAGRPPVYLLSLEPLLEAIGRAPEDYRARGLLQLGGAPIERLTVEGPGPSTTARLIRDGRDWKLADRPSLALDQGACKALIADLNGARVERFLGAADPATLGLQPPSLALSVQAGPVTRRLALGSAVAGTTDLLFVSRDGEPRRYEVRLEEPRRLFDLARHLRSNTLLRFRPWACGRVTLFDAEGGVLRRLVRDGARLVQSDLEHTDPGRLKLLKEALGALEAQRFLFAADAANRKRCGLADGQGLRLEVLQDGAKAAEGGIAVDRFSLTFGAPARTEDLPPQATGAPPMSLRYAMMEDGDSIMLLDATPLDLMQQGFATAREQAKGERQ